MTDQILTPHQRGYIDAAIGKLEALRDGTLQAGSHDGVSTNQKLAQLRHVAECVDVVINDIRREQDGLPSTELAGSTKQHVIQGHIRTDTKPDHHGNRVREEGVDRCACGSKYWENDRCVDCGATYA